MKKLKVSTNFSGTKARTALSVLTVLIIAVVGIRLLHGSSAASNFTVYDPSDPNYPSKVDFAVPCATVKTAPDDPIIYPGQAGMSHNHTFSGNLSINASSTPDSLYTAGTTNCRLSRDHASYWMPTLYADGVAVIPYETRAYYRAGTNDGSKIQPVPFGLRIIAGDAKATAPQAANRAGFQCRNLDSGNTVPKQSLPPACVSGDFLEASVVFPNCWDGVHLDSADHKSHMAYSASSGSYACPAGYPVQLPQLTFAERYPPNATLGKTLTLATMLTTNSLYTLHSDFMNAWDPAMMQYLVDSCIHKNTACEDMSNKRLPTGNVPDPSPPNPSPSPSPSPTPDPTPVPMDMTPPTVTLTAPASAMSIPVGTAGHLAANAADDVGVSKVQFYAGTTLVKSDSATPFDVSWDTTSTATGIYKITALAYDDAGNTTTSAAVNLTITAAGSSLVGDINDDGRINVIDLSLLVNHDGQSFASCDLNHDGTVGAADLAILISKWSW